MSPADRYEQLDALPPLDVVARWAVRERSLGIPGVLHQVGIAGSPPTVREECRRLLRLWATVRHPRLPLLRDAWVDDTACWFVTLELEGEPLTTPESIGLLRAVRRSRDAELAWQSLSAITGLHDRAISHRHLAVDAWRIAPVGRVFMTDWGLCRRMAEAARNTGGGPSNSTVRFELGSSMLARDVTDWALIISEALLGEVLFADDATAAERRSAEGVRGVTARLQKTFGKDPLASFLIKALMSASAPSMGFESASAALTAFPGGGGWP